MDTIDIEILRTGQVVNQLLQKGVDYIAICGSQPAKDFTINCDQNDFDEHIRMLRYEGDENMRLEGIRFFQELITCIIEQIYPSGINRSTDDDFLHLRLVTTPKEIAQLPFEITLTPQQVQQKIPQLPFFLNPDIKTTFTREVRQISVPHYKWPARPRILFAWAQPNNPVPWQQHWNTLINLLRPWAVPLKTSTEFIPDLGPLITKLPDATLASIKTEVRKAMTDKNPYTHIHLLAHGSSEANPDGEQFLLVLNNEDKNRRSFHADGKSLAESLTCEADGDVLTPQVVSLIACDSGNIGSPVRPAGSLAHVLHESGIPCVFASQFPLTQEGSVKLVEALYSRLLESSDPRLSLYHTRAFLGTDLTHDWASLVAYARFPEDIDEQMKDVSLQIMLRFMETSNAYADHIINNINILNKERIGGYFQEVNDRLDHSIINLTLLLESSAYAKKNKVRYAEHCGLIGSAYKRKAEHLFSVLTYQGNNTETSLEAVTTALREARSWYYKGYSFLNSHWNGTQFLSLTLWMNDTEIGDEEQEVWLFCKVLANNDERNAADDESRAWSYGTLIELYLLKPYTMQLNDRAEEKKKSLSIAKKYVQLLKSLKDQSFPIESTCRQLKRYINWWPALSQNMVIKELGESAAELKKELTEDAIC